MEEPEHPNPDLRKYITLVDTFLNALACMIQGDQNQASAVFLFNGAPFPIGDGINMHVRLHFWSTSFEPGLKIPALRDVESFQLRTTVENGFDPLDRDSNAPPDGKDLQLPEMECNIIKTIIRNCTPAEGNVQ